MKDIQATIIINLEGKTSKDLLKQTDRSRRKNINRANSYGLLFKEADEKDWHEYYSIYSKIWKEGGVNPQSIQDLKKGNYKLFIVKKDDKVLGGGLIEIKKDGINFVAFASLIEYQHMRINDFLYWNSIKWALDNKMKFVDLGGYQLNPKGHMIGINNFKEKWGGRIVKHRVRGNLFYILGRKVIRNSRTARWLWDRIKKRPVSRKDKDIKYKEKNF